MSVNDEAFIGTKKRPRSQDEISYEIEAMPTPNSWGVEPANARGKGHLRVAQGKILFQRLNITLKPVDEPKEDIKELTRKQALSLVKMDPADKIIGNDKKRSVRSREDNVDLFALEQQIKSKLKLLTDTQDGEQYDDLSGDGENYAKADYRNARDAEKIRFELNERRKKLMFNLIELGAVTLFLAIIEIVPAFGWFMPALFLPEKSPVTYLLIELAAMGFALYVSFDDIKAEVKNLRQRKCSTRTVISVAMIAEILHIIYMLVFAIVTRGATTNSFAAPICLAVWIYTLNRLLISIRVARGFNFVIKRDNRCEVMAADDSPIAANLRIASGLPNSKISYAVRTHHLDKYFQNACRDDNCSLMMSKVYPYFLLASLVTALIGAMRGMLSGGDFIGMGFSALCASLVASIPITGLLCMEIPLGRAVKNLSRKGALLNGWNAVEKFGNTDTLAINTTDLFPRGSVKIRRAVAVSDMPIQKITAVTAALTTASGGALAEVFGALTEDEKNFTGTADSITYENELGLWGWVDEKQIMIGNRDLMETHNIIIPGGGLARLDEFEEMKTRSGHQVLYVAVNKRLVGVYLLEYKASAAIRNALVQLISDGTNLLIYTCDANINVRLITDVFDIPSRYFSILDNDGSSVYDSVTCAVTEKEEVLLATNGTLKALAGGVKSAVKLKENQNLGLMIQAICFGMGFLFVAGLSCISSYAIDAAQIIVMQLVFILMSLVSVVRAM